MPKATAQQFPPLSPREYLAFLCSRLGKSYVTVKFNVSERTVERWTADERYVGEESVRKGPVEKFKESLTDLMDRGHSYEARGIVADLAWTVKCRLECEEAVDLDHEDWRDELLDNLDSFARYHEAVRAFMQGDLTAAQMRHAEMVLIHEINRTTARALGERERLPAEMSRQCR